MSRSRVRDGSAGRLGGEEFGWVMPMTEVAAARLAGERVRGAIAGTLLARHDVTASISIAAWRPGMDVSALLVAADRQLYRAKAAGRNRVSADGAADEPEAGPVA